MSPKPNIVPVHGAFADGSSWSKVIPLLQEKGYNVTAAKIFLTSLADEPNATGLVYIAAFAPDAGEVLSELQK